jgi:hypothetical protein
MANPYDFTSGYFQSRSLAEQRQQAADIKEYRTEAIKLQRDEMTANAPYKAALARQADASVLKLGAETEGIGLGNDLTRTYIPRIQQLLNRNSPKLGAKGGATFDPKKFASPDYGFKADYNLIEKDQSELADGAVQGAAFADGTKGGLRINRNPQAINTSAEVAQPDAMAPERISPLQVLSENDPQKATTLTQNIFGATPKEFQEMLGAFSIIDFARGKATSKDLLNQVDNIRKMQAEGVGVAIQRGLAGDFKGAQSAFDESGDQRFGDNIQSMKKIKIENVVPGAALKTKDFYEGLELTLKDGKTMTLDPRRLLAETVSLKEVVDNDYRFGNSIRQNDASVFNTQSANARTALDRQLRNDQLGRDDELKRDKLLGSEFSLYVKGRQQAFTRDNPGNTIDPELKQQRIDEIEQMGMVGYNIAKINLRMGNKNITAGSVVPYLPFMGDITNQVTDKAKIEFWKDPKNFARGEDGKPLGMEFENRKYLQTRDGTFLPMPYVDLPPAPPPNPRLGGNTSTSEEDRQRYIRNRSPGFQDTPRNGG